MGYRIKSMKNFRQADSRWGNYPYKDRPYVMATSGCGATSCADIIVSNPKFKNYTPKQTRKFMLKHGYVVNGQGTAWAGIDACLRWYGFNCTWHSTMSAFFKAMAKGKRRGILLFRGGTRGGVTWTTGGHYVAVAGYKVVNGKHYLYTLDPGFRHNDGWHCYETTIRGLIINCWTAYLPEKKKAEKPAKKSTEKKKPAKKKTNKKETPKKTTPKKTVKKKRVYPEIPKRGFFKTGDKGVNVKRLQTLLNKAGFKCGKVDGVYGDKTARAVRKLQAKYGIVIDGCYGKISQNALKKALK